MTTFEAAFFDIETIPCQSLPEECRPVFDEAKVLLGNLKDRFKIEEKIQAERLKFEADLCKKMSLDPDLCQVCCMVGLTNCKDVLLNDVRDSFACVASDDDVEEYELVYDAWRWITAMFNRSIPLVSFNGKSFDLSVLIRRAMILDIYVSPFMLESLLRRAPNRSHIDLMESLSRRNPFSGKMEGHSLDYYLKRFSLGGKLNGMTGSDVFPLWEEKQYGKIVEYCTVDVKRTAALFERVAPWIVTPKTETIIDNQAVAA